MDGVLTMVLAAAYVIAIIAPNTGHQNFMIPALLDALMPPLARAPPPALPAAPRAQPALLRTLEQAELKEFGLRTPKTVPLLQASACRQLLRYRVKMAPQTRLTLQPLHKCAAAVQGRAPPILIYRTRSVTGILKVPVFPLPNAEQVS